MKLTFPPCFVTNFKTKVVEFDDNDPEQVKLVKEMVDLFAKSEGITAAPQISEGGIEEQQ